MQSILRPGRPQRARGPHRIQTDADVVNLAGALGAETPAKELDRNLVVGSWNLREFGRLTPRSVPKADDKPSRNVSDVWASSTSCRFHQCEYAKG